MKTVTQEKFEKIIKQGFQEILKSLGFKKKTNNFYLQLEELGQIINIQKSKWSTKDDISFTINTGIFLPEYWSVFYNYQHVEIPKFPTEPVCLIRKRIGELRYKKDTWYELNEQTDENSLIEEIQSNIHFFILPYFEKLNTKQKLLLEIENLIVSPSLSKMIVFGELNQFEKANKEFHQLLSKESNQHFLEKVRNYANKYELE